MADIDSPDSGFLFDPTRPEPIINTRTYYAKHRKVCGCWSPGRGDDVHGKCKYTWPMWFRERREAILEEK